MKTTSTTRRRGTAIITGALLAASAVVAGNGATAVAEETPKPASHWGQYRWDGAKVKADDRAFWLFDRTDDPMLHSIIEAVAGSWNSARAENMKLEGDKAFETPYVRVHRDDKNAGQCFVNETPGYSAASACTLPFDFKVISARSSSDTEGHLTGGAFALGKGLGFEDAFTAVCRGFGVMMGLDAKVADETSCMSKDGKDGKLLWYTAADADAVKALYKGEGHDDKPVVTTTTKPTTTTTIAPAPGQ